MRFIVAFLTAALLTGGSRAAEPPETRQLPELLDSYRGLSLGTAALPAEGKELKLGNLKLTFASGSLVPLRGRQGEVLGFVFEGSGNYAYRAMDDPPSFALNLKRNANLLVPNQDTVYDGFQHALVFSAAPLIPELEQASGPVPGAAAGSFDRIWKRIGQTYLQYDHLAAEARLGQDKLQYVYVEIEGAKTTVGYMLDRVRTFDELFMSFRKYQGIDLREQVTLNREDVTKDGDPIVAADLLDAQIDVATADNKTGTIHSDLTFRAQRDGLRVLPLHLMNNRAEESYNWACTENQLRVKRVLTEDGKDLAFSHRYNEVLVQLPAAVKHDQTFRLKFETEGEVFTGFGGSRDDNYFELFGTYWFPQPFTSTEAYTYGLKVKTKKPWRPAASGTTVAFRETDTGFELETRSSIPSRDAAVFAGNYKVREEKIGNITYRINAYAMARKQVLENMPKLADAITRFYESKLGPAPFDDLDIVEIPYSWGMGIAPSGMVLLTTEAYRSQLVWEVEYQSRGVNAVLAHEIAHQWFGHKAMPPSGSQKWMAESMAEYASGLAMAALNPDERQAKGWKAMYAEWKGNVKECGGVPLDAAAFLGGSQGSADAWCVLYNKGPLVLHMFRTSVGDQAFWAVMKKYLDDASNGPATEEDLKSACKGTLRADMGWFWDEWAHKGGIPEVKVTHEIRNEGGKVVLAGRVQQSPDGFLKMVIPLVMEMPGGQRDVRVFVQEQPSQDFRFELAAAPSKVTVDPANNNLAVYR